MGQWGGQKDDPIRQCAHVDELFITEGLQRLIGRDRGLYKKNLTGQWDNREKLDGTLDPYKTVR